MALVEFNSRTAQSTIQGPARPLCGGHGASAVLILTVEDAGGSGDGVRLELSGSDLERLARSVSGRGLTT